MSGLIRKSTGDLKAAAGRDPSKPRPSSTTPGPPTSSAPPPSSIPRPAPFNRQTSTPTHPTSYRNEVNTNANNQNNTETTGVGLSVGLGLGGFSGAPKPSPPGPANGRGSAALRRSTSAQSKLSGRPNSSVTATGSPARIPVLSNRNRRLKKREGSQDGISNSSASSSEMESDTSAAKDFFGGNKESHPVRARELYVTIFNKYDPANTGSVAVRDVVAILRELEQAFGGTEYSILSADGESAVGAAVEKDPTFTLTQTEFEDMILKMLGFGLIDRLIELQSTSTSQEPPVDRQQSTPGIDTSASGNSTFEGLGGGLLRSPRFSPRRSPSNPTGQEDSLFNALHSSPRPYAEGDGSVGDDSTGLIGGPPLDSSTPIRARKPVNLSGSEPALGEPSLKQRGSANTEEGIGEDGRPLAVNPMWLEMSLEPASLSGLTVENLRDLLQEFRQFWEDFETRRRRLEEVDRKLNRANQRYTELVAYWEQRYDTIENKNQALQKEKERLAEEAKKFESQYTKGTIMIRTMEDEIAKSETRIEELEHSRKQEVRRREEVQLLLQREVNASNADRASLTDTERMNEKLLSEAKIYIRDVEELKTELKAKEVELSTKERDIADRDMRIENLEKEVNKVTRDCRALESQSRAADRAPKGSIRVTSRRLGDEIGNFEPEEPQGLYDSLEDVFKDYPHFRPTNPHLPQSMADKDTGMSPGREVYRSNADMFAFLDLPSPSDLGTNGIGEQDTRGVLPLTPRLDVHTHHLTTIFQDVVHAASHPVGQGVKSLLRDRGAAPEKTEPRTYDAITGPVGQRNSEARGGPSDETEGQGSTRYSDGAIGGAGGSDDPDSPSDGDDDGGRGGRGGRGHRGGGRRGRRPHDPRAEGGRGVWVGQFRFTGTDGEYVESIRTTLETRAYLKDLADKPRLTLADVEFLTNFISEQSSPPDQVILQEIWGLASKAERAARRTLREEAWPARGEKATFGLVSVNNPFGIFAWPWRQLWDIAFSLDDADYQLPGTNAYQDYINEQRARTARGGNNDDNVDPPATAQRQSSNDPGISAKLAAPMLPRRPHQTPVASILRTGPKPGAAWGILTFLGLGLVLTLAIYNSLIFLRMRSDQQSWEFANGSRSSAGPFWSVENSCWSNCLSGVWSGRSQSSTRWQQWERLWTLLEDWLATSDEGQILPS
ncbi:unnamed protein product [Tuber aestivum]|uniref:EF-hand domain-containing protein n=1 Tax=Tuber aestivum TaxID=59557 RepID=A0A292Q7U1_9PEZI|nr:unnamed protein product [Tuber aestivum]